MESPRIEAARKGLRRYEGRMCPKCGGTERYVINNGCVSCVKKSKEQSTAKIKQLLEKADHAQAREGA